MAYADYNDLPCPFCSANAVSISINSTAGGRFRREVNQAKCGHCGACGPVELTVDAALEAWRSIRLHRSAARVPAPPSVARV